ncbi:MAG: ATP-binding protein [Candidatus Absconditabacteria bacterium]|nr:ATP-binding protein [Candidatus Absconditabacteria bacterium]
MSQILKKTQDNIFVYDLEGVCLYTNDHLANILGFDPVGKHLHEIFPHRSQEHIKIILSDYKRIRETQKGDIIPVQKEKVANGETRVFSVTREPITWMGNPAIAGIGKDITELFLAKEEVEKANEEIKTTNEELLAINDELNEKNKQLEIAKKEAEKAKEQMENLMRHIIHDIRSPVSTVLGCLDNVLYQISGFDESKKAKIEKFLNIALVSGNFSLELVNELGNYSREKKTGIRIEKKEISSQEYIANLKDQWKAYLDEMNKKNKIMGDGNIKKIEILLENSDILPKDIYIDPLQLNRILTNLVSNAIKFTDEGSVSLCIEKIEESEKKGWYRFQIIDTGIGIDPKNHQLIFDEFKKIDSEYVPPVNGRGVGLSVVKSNVEALGGYMLPIKSEIGKGSTFSFEIPLINN